MDWISANVRPIGGKLLPPKPPLPPPLPPLLPPNPPLDIFSDTGYQNSQQNKRQRRQVEEGGHCTDANSNSDNGRGLNNLRLFRSFFLRSLPSSITLKAPFYLSPSLNLAFATLVYRILSTNSYIQHGQIIGRRELRF